MKILRETSFGMYHDKKGFNFWCPACDMPHGIPVEGPNSWRWNGNLNQPSFTPSIKVTMGPRVDPDTGLALPESKRRICHSFVTDGKIEYCSDCTHQRAGQTVSMIEWPGYLIQD